MTASLAVQLVGGVTVLAAGVVLLLTGHGVEGGALTAAGATELGVKVTLLH